MRQKALAAMCAVVLVAGAGYAAVASRDAYGASSDSTHGIPDSNPSHQPEDGDGVCEKGETVVKITPSGNHVTVPCQTTNHG
jgi:hypothetical protein